MSHLLVRRALETKLKAWADAQAPAVPIAFENVPFDPPVTRFARSYLLPLPVDCETLDGIHRNYEGVYQVTLDLPAGDGPLGGETLLASLDAAFSPSAPLTFSGLTVWITRPMSARVAQQDADRYLIPVSCTYRADTTT